MTVDIATIRTEYERAGLRERDTHPSPAKQVEHWLREAIEAGHPEPNAMTLATATSDGVPSARVVLLRSIDANGAVFYTSYESEKGRHLAENPRASAVFFWPLLERQIRISGHVTKVDREASEAYFRTRPRASQLGAWASRQSAVLRGRVELEEHLMEVTAKHRDGDVPCPPRWGGYRISLERVELWQGRPSRLHDRLRYARVGERRWKIERLAP
jgi:pyridoxamine 5'-phosphate oxidase